MLGYAFMGKAHSRACRELLALDAPLRPRLVSVAGRNEEAVAAMAERFGYERWTTDWHDLVSDPGITLFDNGGPNSLHAEPTIAAAEAGKHVLCEKPLGRDADESYEIWQRVEATGVKHLCGFNYRFVPAVRLARELIDAGELGEIRHFRGRYLQDWGDDPSLDTWRFQPDEAGSGAIGDLGTHVVDLARYLVGEVASVSALVRTFVPGRRVDDCSRGGRRVHERRRGHARGDAARARPAQRVPVGDQRLQGLGRLRHGEAERAAGLPRRRRSRARLQDRARLGDRPPVLEPLVAARAHHRLGRDVHARDPPPPAGDRRRDGGGAARRDVRGRLPGGRGVRRDRALERHGRAASPSRYR